MGGHCGPSCDHEGDARRRAEYEMKRSNAKAWWDWVCSL